MIDSKPTTNADTDNAPDELGEDQHGISCPGCGCRHLIVLDTRKTWGSRIRRRRQCRHCARKVTTYEKLS